MPGAFARASARARPGRARARTTLVAASLVACLSPGVHGDASAADEIHWTITGQTSVTFDWRGSEGERVLRYGTSSGAYTDSVTAATPVPDPDSSPGPFWEARLVGLAQDTRYYYAIGGGPERTFRTPIARGSSGYWFAAQSDLGSTLSGETFGPAQAMLPLDHPAIPGDDRPRFVLVSGDLTHADLDSPAHVDQHFNDVMAWSTEAAYMPAWGNHDWATAAEDEFDNLNNYEGRFDFPNSQSSPGAANAVGNGPGEDWSWFDYGNVRFVSFPEPYAGAWADWVLAVDPVLAAAQSDPAIRFIVVFGHRPAWSSGTDHPSDPGMAQILATLRASYPKLALAFSGHSHHYERTDPAQTGGVVFIVGPNGGTNLGGLRSPQPAWSSYRLDHVAGLRLHVQADRIDGYLVCGPAGSGNHDVCAMGAVVDTWSVVPSGLDAPTGEGPPAEIVLGPAIPNPARSGARFRLSLPASARVTLTAHDVSGRRVGEAVSRDLGAGHHELAWQAPHAGPGVYFVRLVTDGFVRARRTVVLAR